jgi:protein-disulfide isomerase
MTSTQGSLRPDVGVDDHQAGSAEAPVTLVEYGDFQCPHCYRAHPIVMALQKQLGARLRFVFRNFPITQIHPNALHAAEAAESVNANAGPDAYWRMHHAIFEHQQDSPNALDDAHLIRYAASSGADPVQVERDLESDTFEAKVKADFISGVRSGVNGTPTFFINGIRFDGNWTSKSEFADALERAAPGLVGKPLSVAR